MVRAAVAALLGVLCLAALPARAAELPPIPARATVTGGTTAAPWGWTEFCKLYRDECVAGTMPSAVIAMTPENWAQIEHINEWVNSSIEGIPDQDHWGIVERWDMAEDGRGDCEEFVLVKRHAAMEAGFPRQALLITVVLDTHGDGHAVLTVRTDRGDYVLDNLRDAILPWTDTGYQFLKRQAPENQNSWVSIDAPAPAPTLVASSR